MNDEYYNNGYLEYEIHKVVNEYNGIGDSNGVKVPKKYLSK